MGLLVSDEADIWLLLFKYGFNFHYSVGPEFGEKGGVSFIGPFITTTVIYVSLWPDAMPM